MSLKVLAVLLQQTAKKRAFMIYDVCGKKKKKISQVRVLSSPIRLFCFWILTFYFFRYEVLEPKRTPLTLLVPVV